MARKSVPQELKQQILLPGKNPADLQLSFAGNIIKHLGVQMYAGRPVPAIAELISNSWDADAVKVNVRLPLDKAWNAGDQTQVIEVSDDGNGMTWNMIRDAYLDVGRDRREAEKTDRSTGGRLLQGRKGVGKLAGFGIADTLEIQTVHKNIDPTIKEKALIWFKLDLSGLKKVTRGPAPVDVLYAGPVSRAPSGARRTKGTTITLRHLHERRVLRADLFHREVAQRFLLLPQFEVKINGKRLRPEEIDLQWRWPSKGWTIENVPGCGPVHYWIGFTEKPRKQNEGELSGVLIYTRGKISQEATFFDISGGVTGQHGLRYLVGMIRAEWLDAGVDMPDYIATPRDAIAWESPQGSAFKDWGQKLLRKYLADWAKLRTGLRVKQIREVSPQVMERIERLTPSYKDVALQFVDKFKSLEMEPREFEDILTWFLDALENATLRKIFQKLRETDVADLQQLDDLFTKMEIRTAVALLQIIDSNLAAIDTLERMHMTDAQERGVLSKHLESNPWLIEPTWMLNKAEGRVATWIKREFQLEKTGKKGDADRADFFCVAVGGVLHIVEIKRGAHIAKVKDVDQAEKYRKYVVKRFAEITEAKGIKYAHVQSHLIAAELDDGAQSIVNAFADKGWVYFTTWDDLIERAKRSHTQFKAILESRATEAEEQAPLEKVSTPTKQSQKRAPGSHGKKGQ